MFRVIAVIVLIAGLIYLIWGITFALSWGMHPGMLLILFLPYLIGGGGLFAASRLLGKLACYGLDKTDER